MKPDWDKLADSFASDENMLIVDVDCTADGRQTCQKMGVKGYPTIRYFNDGTEEKGADYRGGRDFASLKSFAEKTVNIPRCNVQTLDNCSPEDTAIIVANKAKTSEALNEEIAANDASLQEIASARATAEAEWKKQETDHKKNIGVLKRILKSKQ
eukprot:TRINITY_DN9460_c1_g1_i1.p1 TRINITY_DN9460_c1_g1~~TRINITY_DN9460_c1_g1_i1.p1  ORF type:complete len:155 (+),score=41.86 TRINITY_DN9460_c1_g1_i1:38-502(+)